MGEAIRRYKIKINDARWPSNEARSAGMREIAIAQLGSNEIDQKTFARGVALKTIQRILPMALRAVARLFPSHADALEVASVACEAAVNLMSAKTAAYSAKLVAQKTRADAAAYAAAAYAAAADAADAAAYAAYADAAREKILRIACDIGVEVLRELKCPGVKWLGLCKENTK